MEAKSNFNLNICKVQSENKQNPQDKQKNIKRKKIFVGKERVYAE